jgi:putative transposase
VRVSQPRQVLPSSFYLLTRRCTQRQFLLRPDVETNNAYLYCLLVAALRYGIDILLMCAMSNHHHVAIFDRNGRYPEFIEHFHKLFARSQNALRGRWENFWAAGQTSVVRLVDPEDVLAKLVYVATNPVKDNLVERVHHWPGINGYRALITGKTLRATRPRHFFRTEGPMPAAVEAQLTIPPELGDRATFLRRLEEQVVAFEERAKEQRAAANRKVIGRRGILRQSWKAAPISFEPRRVLNPRIAARNLWSRVEALVRNKVFARAYQAARAAWLDGRPAEFPVGTYWLRRFANVPIVAA